MDRPVVSLTGGKGPAPFEGEFWFAHNPKWWRFMRRLVWIVVLVDIAILGVLCLLQKYSVGPRDWLMYLPMILGGLSQAFRHCLYGDNQLYCMCRFFHHLQTNPFPVMMNWRFLN